MATPATEPDRMTVFGPRGIPQPKPGVSSDGSAIGDAARSGFWGQALGAVRAEAHAWQPATPDYQGLQHVPKGYEEFASAFAGATTPDETEAIRTQVEANIAIRQRMAKRSAWTNLGSSLLVGVADPINLIAPEAALGKGILKGAIEGAKTLGLAGAGEELARGGLDPTSNAPETGVSAAMALGLGGVVGGLAGKFGRARAAPGFGIVAPPSDIRRMVRLTMDHGEGTHGLDMVDGQVITSPKGARGRMQVMPATARDPGHGIHPSNGTLEDDARVGEELLGALVRKYGGDKAKAWAAYNWGEGRVDSAVARHGSAWLDHAPKETRNYVSRLLEADGSAPAPGNPAATMDFADGLHIPEELDGVPVQIVDGSKGPAAAFVPGKSPAQLLGEVAIDDARASKSRNQLVGGPVDEDIFAPLTHAYHKDLPHIAAAWARKANGDGDFALKLGLDPNRAIQEREVLDLITRERKTRQIAEANQQLKDGSFPQAHDRTPLYDVEPPVDRSRLAFRVKAIQEKINAFESRLKLLGYGTKMAGNQDLQVLYAQLDQARNVLAEEGGAPADILHGEVVDSVPQSVHLAESDVLARASEHHDPNAEGLSPQHSDPYATRDQVRDAMKGRDVFGGDPPDELPFGMAETTGFGDFDGPHFIIDPKKILGSFASRPWTMARGEVQPFAEDAFLNPAEWLKFVLQHERFHARVDKLVGESDGAYEDRINQLAYHQVVAERNDLGLLHGPARWAIIGTPLDRLHHYVPDAGADIHQGMLELAADNAVQTVLSRAGGSALKQGSVAQRVDMWRAKAAEVQGALRKHYLEELGMGDGGRLLNEVRVLAQRIPFLNALKGRKTFAQFKRDVVAHHVGFTDELDGVSYAEASPSVKAAAAVMGKIEAEVEKEARELGVFAKSRDLQREHDRAVTDLRVAEVDMRALREGSDQHAAATATAEQLKKKIGALEAEMAQPTTVQGSEIHWHKRYDRQTLIDKKDEALAALEKAYTRVGHENPTLAAGETYDHLVMDPENLNMRLEASGAKRIEIPWDIKESFPFVQQDPELIYGLYLRQMGARIEMTRSFGDGHALDAIDRYRADLKKRGIDDDATERALQLFMDARDHINGQFHRTDAMAWDYRTTRVIKMLTQLVTLGKVIYSQVGDVGRFIGTQGLGVKHAVTGDGPIGLIGALAGAFRGDISRFHPGGIAKQAGEALDLVNMRLAALQMNDDAAVLALKDTKFERALARAQVPFFILNLMTPWTVAMKEMAGLAAAHNIIEDARLLAKAVRSGAEPDAKLVARLGQNQFTALDALKLADMPTERGAQGLHLPNVLAWEGEVGHEMRTKLLTAVNGEIKRTIVTPGQLDRPRVFDGVFYSKTKRDAALEEVAAKKDAVDEAASALKAFDNEKLGNRVGRAELLDALKEASGAYDEARARVGQESRVYAPLASFPFQLHSFAFASGGKVLHGLLSAPERNKVGGVLGLFMTGMLITWLKTIDPLGGATGTTKAREKAYKRWDRMSMTELVAHSFDYSNIGAVFTDVVKNAYAAAEPLMGDPAGLSQRPPGSPARVSDEVGATMGPGPGLVAGLVEPFVRGDPYNERVAAVRRIVPFANLIWWKGAVDRLEALAHTSNGTPPAAQQGGGGGPVSVSSVAHPSFIGGSAATPSPPGADEHMAQLMALAGAPAAPGPGGAAIPGEHFSPATPLPDKPPSKRRRKKLPPHHDIFAA